MALPRGDMPHPAATMRHSYHMHAQRATTGLVGAFGPIGWVEVTQCVTLAAVGVTKIVTNCGCGAAGEGCFGGL